MTKYWLLLRLFIQSRLDYRGDMVVFSIGTILAPLIGLAVWLTASSSGTLAYTQSELIAYFIAAIYIGIFAEMWQSWMIGDWITNGDMSSLLLKPIPFLGRFIVELLADKFFKMSVVTLTFPLIFLMVPKEVWNNFFINPLSLLLFATSLIAGFFILLFIEISIGLATVWFFDIDFIKGLLGTVDTIFSGRFIPLIFLPAGLASVATFLPFRYAVSFPIEILLNKIDSTQILNGFIIEGIWLILSFILYKVVLHYFRLSYQGYGS